MDETKHDCPAFKTENKPEWIRIKASIILCPALMCSYRIKEVPGETADLGTLFEEHMKAHALTITEGAMNWIRAAISQMRNNDYIPYCDPFFTVPESVIKVP